MRTTRWEVWTEVWTNAPGLGMNRVRAGDDAPELEVCGNPGRKSLVSRVCEGIELTYAVPQGKAGWLRMEGPHDRSSVRRTIVADTG